MLYNIFWFETAIFVPNNPIITHIIIGRKCSKGWIPQKKPGIQPLQYDCASNGVMPE